MSDSEKIAIAIKKFPAEYQPVLTAKMRKEGGMLMASHIGSSSIHRGELSFLPLVQFCICLRDSVVLTSYLFRQWPACVRVPDWKNVL